MWRLYQELFWCLNMIYLPSSYSHFFFLNKSAACFFFIFFSPDQTNKWNRFPLRFLVNRLVKFDDDLLLQTKNRNEREVAFNWHYFTLLTSRASPSLLLFSAAFNHIDEDRWLENKAFVFQKGEDKCHWCWRVYRHHLGTCHESWVFCRSILRRRRKILIKMQHLWLIDKTKKAKNILKKDIKTFSVIGKHSNCLRKKVHVNVFFNSNTYPYYTRELSQRNETWNYS